MGGYALLCLRSNSHTVSAVLSDPTAFEEPLLSMTINVVLDADGKIVQVGQWGTTTAEGQDVLLACIRSAKERNVRLRGLL